jgi:hypothetical protein
MSFRNYTISWPLLEKIPAGHIKDNLREIQKELEKIESVVGVLRPLSDFESSTDVEVTTLANATITALICIIDAGIDSVFYNLNELFDPDKAEAAQGGEA